VEAVCASASWLAYGILVFKARRASRKSDFQPPATQIDVTTMIFDDGCRLMDTVLSILEFPPCARRDVLIRVWRCCSCEVEVVVFDTVLVTFVFEVASSCLFSVRRLKAKSSTSGNSSRKIARPVKNFDVYAVSAQPFNARAEGGQHCDMFQSRERLYVKSLDTATLRIFDFSCVCLGSRHIYQI
jgi:hypothetical protein